MINYNIGTIVFLSMLTAIYPAFVATTISPFNILIIILLVVAFEVITFFLLARRREIQKRPVSESLQVPRLSSKDSKTQVERVNDLNEVLEPFGFAYYPDQDIFYSVINGWQREFGYCQLYDEMSAPLCMIIDCEPIRFEYGGKKWLIEFWKGQYGMTTGCEVGIYTATGPSLDIPGLFHGTFYKCASEEDYLPMTVSLRKNNTVLFTRNDCQWWLTGFVLGEFSQSSELIMDIVITLQSLEMCNAFVEELINVGYSMENLRILDSTVYLTYDKPYSPQPITRIPLTENAMQKYNQQNCEAYERLTKLKTNTLDKLDYVQKESPRMYQQILNLGKPKQLFDDFNIIKQYLDEDNESPQ